MNNIQRNRAKHFGALATRYGIKPENLAAFIKSAKYYETLLQFYAVWECNGRDQYGRRYTERTEEEQTKAENRAKKRLCSLCENREKAEAEFHTNRDPRGYALKFNPTDRGELLPAGLNTDWGGYISIYPDNNALNY